MAMTSLATRARAEALRGSASTTAISPTMAPAPAVSRNHRAVEDFDPARAHDEHGMRLVALVEENFAGLQRDEGVVAAGDAEEIELGRQRRPPIRPEPDQAQPRMAKAMITQPTTPPNQARVRMTVTPAR